MNLEKRKSYRRNSKKNPWRNTRNDKEIPWREIWAAVFMIILPIMVVTLATNFVFRSEAFYSFHFAKTEVVKEIPFSITQEDLSKTFADYMQHKSSTFQLVEKTEYMPQKLFNDRDGNIMATIRMILDVGLVFSMIFLIGALSIFAFLIRKGEKQLIYGRFLDSLTFFGALLLVNLAINLIVPVRELIFRMLFGVRFPPGDVLIQIFQTKFSLYLAGWELVASVVIMGVIGYFVHLLASRRKMFRKVEE
ncbi:MAG: DUF1461 domain-containing protein [Anaerovoracaceae bacterium]